MAGPRRSGPARRIQRVRQRQGCDRPSTNGAKAGKKSCMGEYCGPSRPRSGAVAGSLGRGSTRSPAWEAEIARTPMAIVSLAATRSATPAATAPPTRRVDKSPHPHLQNCWLHRHVETATGGDVPQHRWQQNNSAIQLQPTTHNATITTAETSTYAGLGDPGQEGGTPLGIRSVPFGAVLGTLATKREKGIKKVHASLVS